MKPIRKAVFPVAGFGTRFVPATKAMPKELLSIVDKPLIQYAAEEAVAAGIDTLIFVTGRKKRAIEDHFDSNQELEAALRAKGKTDQADMVRNILPHRVERSCRSSRSTGLTSRNTVWCNQEPLLAVSPVWSKRRPSSRPRPTWLPSAAMCSRLTSLRSFVAKHPAPVVKSNLQTPSTPKPPPAKWRL